MVDHYVLSRADHLAVSNSSFSFTAAMLNDRARTFVRPNPNLRRLVAFEPWSADVLMAVLVQPDEVPLPERVLLSRQFRVTRHVIHVGQYCSPWTNLARAVHPKLRIAELGPEARIDGFRERARVAHIGHLVLGEADAAPRIIEGASRTLSRSRIDTLHFRVTGGRHAADAALQLGRFCP